MKHGSILPLDPADPRSIDHPGQEETWLELARALGRALANRDFDRKHGLSGRRIDTIRPAGV